MGNQILQPSVSLTLTGASQQVDNAPQKVLMLGAMIGTPTAEGTLVEDVGNAGQENALFGRTSPLADMVRMFKRIAPQVQLDVIPVGEGTTATVYSVTFTGTSSEAGTIDMIVGSDKYHKTQTAIPSGTAAAAVPALVLASINANLNTTFTAADATGGVLSLTCDAKGTVGNTVPIGAILNGATAGLLAGLTVAITVDTPGATDSAALADTDIITDAIGTRRYQGVVAPFTAFDVLVGAWLDTRFNTNNRILDGVNFTGIADTFSNVNTLADGQNSKSLVILGDLLVPASDASDYYGPTGQEAMWNIASAFAAVRALRLTADASLSQYLTTTSSRDQFGGPALASLPYFNTTIPQLPIGLVDRGFTDIEIETLHDSGAAIVGRNASGTGNLVGEVPTTYEEDASANEDLSWKYLNYVDTMSQVREYFFNNLKSRFAQSRLTEGVVIRGRDMVNQPMFEAYLDQLYGDLSGSDFVLLQAGEEALTFFKTNRTVVLDLSLGKVTVTMLTPIVTQTRTIIGTIQIAFSTTES